MTDRTWTDERTPWDAPDVAHTIAPSEAWADGYNAAIAAYLAQLPDPSAPIEGLANAHSPETSHRAAREPNHRIKWGEDRCRVLSMMANSTPAGQGWTAAELADRWNFVEGVRAEAGVPHLRYATRNQIAARLLELRTMSLVIYSADEKGRIEVRATGPGATGRVQLITPAGREAVARAMMAARR